MDEPLENDIEYNKVAKQDLIFALEKKPKPFERVVGITEKHFERIKAELNILTERSDPRVRDCPRMKEIREETLAYYKRLTDPKEVELMNLVAFLNAQFKA